MKVCMGLHGDCIDDTEDSIGLVNDLVRAHTKSLPQVY